MKRLCFSFHDAPESIKKIVDLGWFEMMTCQYNYLDRKNEEGMAYAAEKGLGICVMGPVGGGRLATLPPPVTARLGIDEAQAVSLALRFVLSNPSVSCALSGMGSIEMVDQNAATVSADAIGGEERADLVKLVKEEQRMGRL